MQTLTHFVRFGLLLLGCLWTALAAHATSLSADDITQGSLMMRNDRGEAEALPLLNTDVSIDVTGPIARTVVTQEFKNPGDTWVEALYLFPLPEDAAVDRMKLLIGERVIEGEIKEKEEAKAVYEQAKAEGKRTALVEQDRPNLFSTSVANIPPGGSVSVSIEYQQTLGWKEGEFSIRFPMAITPRYNGALPEPTHVVEQTGSLNSGWSLLPGERPNQVLPLADEEIDRPVSLRLRLRAGFELAEVKSHYHKILKSQGENGEVDIELAQSSVQADRDFLLSWKPVPSQQPNAALFAETSDKGRFGLLMFTPPQLDGWEKPAREVVFVIDTSGSMGGQSIRAAREALLNGLAGLEAGDSFNIIEFNTDTAALFTSSRPADDQNLRIAERFVSRLEAEGGTNMFPALDLALQPSDSQRLRQVVFITDGAVAQEQELFSHIQRKLAGSRLFTVGIGSAPNTYFMQEAALAGRGFFTYIGRPDEAAEKMNALFERLAKPVLANIQVSGEGVSGFAPAVVPDLYAGEPLVVAMKLSDENSSVQIQGQMGDTLWKQSLAIDAVDQQAGIGIDWARRSIASWQRGAARGVDADTIRNEVTRLALDFHLVSPFTSLVAVDKTPVRPDTESLDTKALPGKMPQGLEVKQTLQLASGATGYELSLLLGSLMLFAALALLLWQRRVNGSDRELSA
ncbi:marine proteobacterial sortase target protein [Marinobacterium lutimaris]|uniref:Ca-activated chloride channel family protein n=1 Tax=Marinobacterium lutimaris TaxID=568106 RepID=A0A1H6AW68_9GAMM|nr:marine proteobacterial sortase target protein [Marinobacterium lutimaris]SEG52026.1 Ca-activated chloride channel family protein [Marinobacterium lutimaris]